MHISMKIVQPIIKTVQRRLDHVPQLEGALLVRSFKNQ